MTTRIVLYVMLALLSISCIYALPAGPTGPIEPISSARWPTWGTQTAVALAGNVTQFNTNTSTITRTWQGYFGNITGVITLGDANNNTLYDWQVTSPQGEIYAVPESTTPDWESARCANAQELADENTRIGIVDHTVEEDAVNRTFVVGGSAESQGYFGGALTHPTFWVSSSQINANTCPVAYLYNGTQSPSANFKEVILSDDGSVPIIYTALLAHNNNPDGVDSIGFDGATHDFQMIVGEDGHGTDTATSIYYFYLEIE